MSTEDSGRITRDGGMSSLIPYRNVKALVGYYLSFLSLIPALGLVLGPVAILLGILGIVHANRNPEAKGMAHAIVAIILGLIGLVFMAPIGLLLLWVVLFAK